MLKMLDDMLKMSKNSQLFFEAVAKVDGKHAYGASAAFNGLFYINLESGECEFIAFFPNEDLYKERLFFSACYYKNKVFFAPQCAHKIYIFHIETKTFSEIDIKEDMFKKYSSRMKFSETFVYKNYVFIIGAYYPAILKINPITEDIECYPIEINDQFLFRRGILRNNKYYIASSISDIFIEIDLDDIIVSKHNLPHNHRGSWNLCDDGTNIWFAPRHYGDCFVRWNPQTNQFIELQEFGKNFFAENKPMYLYAYYYDGYVYAIPELTGIFAKVNVNTLQIEEDKRWAGLKKEKMGFFFSDERKLYLSRISMDIGYYTHNNNTFTFDKQTEQVTPFKFLFMYGKEKFLQYCISYILKNKGKVIREGKIFLLNDMLQMISGYGGNWDEVSVENMIGLEVWRTMENS